MVGKVTVQSKQSEVCDHCLQPLEAQRRLSTVEKQLKKAVKELSTLRDRLAERAEDTERLDWLEKHDAAADNLEIFRNGDPPNLGAWEVFRHIDIGVFQGKTLRAAIDAARAEVKP